MEIKPCNLLIFIYFAFSSLFSPFSCPAAFLVTTDIPAKPKMELILNTLYPGDLNWEEIKRKILRSPFLKLSPENSWRFVLHSGDKCLFQFSSCSPTLCDPRWAPHLSVANYHLIISFTPSPWNSESLWMRSFEYLNILVKPVDPSAPLQKDAGFPEVLCHGWDPCAYVSINPESPATHKFIWRTTTCLKWV